MEDGQFQLAFLCHRFIQHVLQAFHCAWSGDTKRNTVINCLKKAGEVECFSPTETFEYS